MNLIRRQLKRIRADLGRLLERLSISQKVSLLLLAALVSVGLLALVRLPSTSGYVDFIRPASVEELARLRSVLELEGIAYRVEDAGEGIKLQVAPGLLARARWLAISSGGYSGSDDNFDWIFEKGSLTDTNHKVERRVEESRRRTAEETIRASRKVCDATVLIQRGPAPIFATDESSDTASVALELAAGTDRLTAAEASAIRTFMVGSFRLPPQNIQITDNRWNNYPYSESVDGVNLSEEQRRLKNEILLAVNGMYGRMFGPAEFVVSVLVDVSQKRSRVDEEVYDETTSLSLAKETETLLESDVPGHAGPSGAIRPANFSEGGGAEGVRKSSFENFPSRKRTQTEIPAGQLRGVSVNLVLDRRAVLRNMRDEHVILPGEPGPDAGAEARKAWSEELEGAIGVYLERHRNIVRDLLPRSMTNVVTKVSAVSFPRPAVSEERASLSGEFQGWFSRYGKTVALSALGLLGLLVALRLLRRGSPPLEIPGLEERAIFGHRFAATATDPSLGRAVTTAELQDDPRPADGNTPPVFEKLPPDFSLGRLAELEAPALLSLLQGEHPQTVAVIVSQLDAQRAAEVLDMLDPRTQSEIVSRIANMEPAASGRSAGSGSPASSVSRDSPGPGERRVG